MSNILILGGTTEASALAAQLAFRGDTATLSYAGRVAQPRAQPIPVRVGGFGGIDGLADYLADRHVTHLVDATHPFAAQMNANAVTAAARVGVAHIALTRPAWAPVAGDNWTHVADIDAAVAALAGSPRRILLALGRMHVDAFAAQPQHHYQLRFVDAPDHPPSLPDHHLIVCKNAGGTGAQAKLVAARALALPVLMIDRPPLPQRREVHAVDDVLNWLDHGADRGV